MRCVCVCVCVCVCECASVPLMPARCERSAGGGTPVEAPPQLQARGRPLVGGGCDRHCIWLHWISRSLCRQQAGTRGHHGKDPLLNKTVSHLSFIGLAHIPSAAACAVGNLRHRPSRFGQLAGEPHSGQDLPSAPFCAGVALVARHVLTLVDARSSGMCACDSGITHSSLRGQTS